MTAEAEAVVKGLFKKIAALVAECAENELAEFLRENGAFSVTINVEDAEAHRNRVSAQIEAAVNGRGWTLKHTPSDFDTDRRGDG